jgi:hypothetical protein
MAYRHDGSGMGGGPLPDKTVGWLWGYLCGAGMTLVAVWIVILARTL